jgi:hypothetical protein
MSSPIDKYLRWDASTKKYLPREERRYILPYWSYFDLSDVQGAYPLPAAGTPARLAAWKQPYTSANGMDANLGTPLEIKYLLLSNSSFGYVGSDFTVSLQEIGESRKFMNQPIHMQTMFGDAQYPGTMCESYMFSSQHQIQAQFVNVSTLGAMNVRAYLAGAQYSPFAAQSNESRSKITEVIKRWNNRQPNVWPFWLTTEQSVSLAGNASGSFEILPGQDAHFVACSLRAFSDADFEYELLEVKTGQSLSNGRSTKLNSIGDARFPTDLPVQYVVPAGYRLRLFLRNLSGATNRIFFTIAGKKVSSPLIDVPELADCKNIMEVA